MKISSEEPTGIDLDHNNGFVEHLSMKAAVYLMQLGALLQLDMNDRPYAPVHADFLAALKAEAER